MRTERSWKAGWFAGPRLSKGCNETSNSWKKIVKDVVIRKRVCYDIKFCVYLRNEKGGKFIRFKYPCDVKGRRQ